MQKDPSEIIREIVQDLRRLETPLREKSWTPILEYLTHARVAIKGTPRDPAYLTKLLSMQSAGVRHLEVVLEELLGSRIDEERVELKVRVAAVGRRIEGGAPDGIIMDSRLLFVLRGGRWQPDEVTVDCPPEWAQWNNRPNTRAPIHYGDPEWWERRPSRS
jgi:hypothetical protein